MSASIAKSSRVELWTADPACDYHARFSRRRPAPGEPTAARPSEVTLAGFGWCGLSPARNWSGWWESNPR